LNIIASKTEQKRPLLLIAPEHYCNSTLYSQVAMI